MVTDAESILNIKLTQGEMQGITIKQYFHHLLYTLWVEGEGFSGKRPFGNSGWEHDLYHALAVAGVIHSKVEDYGEGFIEYDYDESIGIANVIITDLIKYIFK